MENTLQGVWEVLQRHTLPVTMRRTITFRREEIAIGCRLLAEKGNLIALAGASGLHKSESSATDRLVP